jgi:NAD-dependent dihydropyrimidine dehydrogenase PreA subunit
MKPVIDKNKCNGCGKCVDMCPVQLFKIENGKAVVKTAECLGCLACEAICPQKAIKVKE